MSPDVPLESRPLDVRLVPAALASWGVAAILVGASAETAAGVGWGALLVAFLLLWRHNVRAIRRRTRSSRRPRHRSTFDPRLAAHLLVVLAISVTCLALHAQQRARESPILTAALEWGGSVEARLELTAPLKPRASAGPDGAAQFTGTATLHELTVRGRNAELNVPIRVLAPASWSEVEVGSQQVTTIRLRSTPAGQAEVAFAIATAPPHESAPAPWWQRLGSRLRADLIHATQGLPDHAQGLLPGIAVGDDSRVPAPLKEAMQASSLGHLLAVSGAHVGIILTGVLLIAGALPRLVRAGLGLFVLAFLLVLVGPGASVVRAVAMGLVVLAAGLLGRRSTALAALAAAVIFLVVLDPWIARSTGFILSVAATAGLVLLASRWARALSGRLPPVLATAIAVPAAAQAACLPFIVASDGYLGPYGVIANALVAPVIAPVTVLALLAVVCAPLLPGVAHGLLWLAQGGTWWIEWVARSFQHLPGARVPWPTGITGSALLLAVMAMIWWIARDEGRRRAVTRASRRFGLPFALASAALAVTTVVLLILPGTRTATTDAVSSVLDPSFPPAGWQMVQCDVGQGSALVLATGQPDRAVMVDVGPAGGAAAACLRSLGIRTLDLLVLTHADADHVGSLTAVREVVEIEQVVVPRTTDSRMPELIRDLRADGLIVTELDTESQASRGQVGDLTYRTLWPTPRAVELGTPEDGNDLSLTLWMSTADLTVLIHGDLSAPPQQAMIRMWPDDLPRTPDVLVVAHHGSADQDREALATQQPRIALISVGVDNDYGHPAQSTLEVLEDQGVLIGRTDLCGPMAISLLTDGNLGLAGCR